MCACPSANAGTHNPRIQFEAGRSNKQIAEITPFKIFPLYQLDLPIPLPAFQLFLAGDRFVRAIVGFDISEAVYALGFDKRRALAVSMLFQPLL